jgi:hypothetical protein
MDSHLLFWSRCLNWSFWYRGGCLIWSCCFRGRCLLRSHSCLSRLSWCSNRINLNRFWSLYFWFYFFNKLRDFFCLFNIFRLLLILFIAILLLSFFLNRFSISFYSSKKISSCRIYDWFILVYKKWLISGFVDNKSDGRIGVYNIFNFLFLLWLFKESNLWLKMDLLFFYFNGCSWFLRSRCWFFNKNLTRSNYFSLWHFCFN